MRDLQIHPTLPERRDFRIGILGSGHVVDTGHLPAYRKAGFDTVAIASRTPDRAAAVARRHGVLHVHDNYQCLLEDASIDVLVVAVPPSVQLSLIREACRKRIIKGILAETPLGMNFRQALEAVSLCEEAGIKLVVNQSVRYDQSVRAARSLLEDGVFGEPVLATIDARSIPRWMPWHRELRWLTLRLISIHHLDMFRYWFGDPQSVYCSVRTDPRVAFPHNDGICCYILDYSQGLRCVGVDDTWAGPVQEGCPASLGIQWRIEGTNGLAIGRIGCLQDPHPTPSTIRYAARGDLDFHRPAWTETYFPDAFLGTMAQLLAALETATTPHLSGRDYLNTLALVEAAHASAAQARAVSPADVLRKAALIDALSTNDPTGLSALALARSSSDSAGLAEPFDLHHLTPLAQRVLVLAREEARCLHHFFVGTEHLLLGLLQLGQGTAVEIVRKQGIDLDQIRSAILKQVGPGPPQAIVGNIPITPRTRKVLSLAAREAGAAHRPAVGTEDVLLGLLLDGDGIAARVLRGLGLDSDSVRTHLAASS